MSVRKYVKEVEESLGAVGRPFRLSGGRAEDSMGKAEKPATSTLHVVGNSRNYMWQGKNEKACLQVTLCPEHRPGCHRLRLVNCLGDLPFARSIHEAKVGRRAGGAATHCVVSQEHVRIRAEHGAIETSRRQFVESTRRGIWKRSHQEEQESKRERREARERRKTGGGRKPVSRRASFQKPDSAKPDSECNSLLGELFDSDGSFGRFLRPMHETASTEESGLGHP